MDRSDRIEPPQQGALPVRRDRIALQHGRLLHSQFSGKPVEAPGDYVEAARRRNQLRGVRHGIDEAGPPQVRSAGRASSARPSPTPTPDQCIEATARSACISRSIGLIPVLVVDDVLSVRLRLVLGAAQGARVSMCAFRRCQHVLGVCPRNAADAFARCACSGEPSRSQQVGECAHTACPPGADR